MKKIDITKPVYLRRDGPGKPFAGPFIGPDKYGQYRAIVDGECFAWSANGRYFLGTPSPMDLIPLAPKPREWLRCFVTHYANRSEFGSAHANERSAEARIGMDGEIIYMTEKAAGDELASAIDDALEIFLHCGDGKGILRDALAKWRAIE